MIVATMFGGPRDGLEVVVARATPLIFPVVSSPVWEHLSDLGNPQPRLLTVTYVPALATMQRCPFCPQEGFTHMRCTYYMSGWGR